MNSCLIVCSDGTLKCQLSNILKHSDVVRNICSDIDQNSCVCVTALHLPSLAVDPTSLAITLLEQATGGEEVRVEEGWLEQVQPCYSLLGIAWGTDGNNNSVDLDPQYGDIQVISDMKDTRKVYVELKFNM